MTLEIRSRGTPAQQAAYEGTIRPLLTTIRGTTTGQIVIRMLEGSAHRVRIVPFGRNDYAEFGFNNAIAMPMSNSCGSFGSERTGRGSGSNISFSVGNLRNRGVQGQNDEVLLHELCHSLRQVSGAQRLRRTAQGGVSLVSMEGGYDNIEEFFAAMVASVYSSERGRRPLGNHNASGLPDPTVLQRPPFSTRLRDFHRRMPEFTRAMAAIPPTTATFNPFRDVPA